MVWEDVRACLLWHGVVSASAPRMAAQYAAYGQPKSAYGTVFFDSFERVTAASGRKTA